jgi:hypothetical protein
MALLEDPLQPGAIVTPASHRFGGPADDAWDYAGSV